MRNALTEIAWVRTTAGPMTVRDVLRQAHDPAIHLQASDPGYVVGTELRVLAAVTAVVLRYDGADPATGRVHDPERLAVHGLSEDAIGQAMAVLEPGADLDDPVQPFMQRPVLTPAGKKDTARRIGPGDQAVKKLLPSMPPDTGEDFWDLRVAQPDHLTVGPATLALAVYQHYSMAGNGGYDGDKPQMGAPGIRYYSKMSATELIWRGDSLLHTLLMMIPHEWVKGDGLPAWVDRTGEKSVVPTGHHPLWRATWSSNTSATCWDAAGNLVGTRVGGIPAAWYVPEMGTTKETRKAWWDQRNEADPFYLYLPGFDGALKAQRIDVGRDATELAVEWAAEGRLEDALTRSSGRVLAPDAESARVVFIRHHIAGTASSPSIRLSEVVRPNEDEWRMATSARMAFAIKNDARLLLDLQRVVVRPFRKGGQGGAKGDGQSAKFPGGTLFNFGVPDADVSTTYWREVAPVYEEIVRLASRTERRLPEGTYKTLRRAVLGAFDAVVAPFGSKDLGKVYAARANLAGRVNGILRKHGKEPANGELTEGKENDD